MLISGITISLIAGALADLASGSAKKIYEDIHEKISSSDEEKLEEELISSLQKRLENEEVSESTLREVVEPINEYVVESVYLSKEDIAEQIAMEISKSNLSLEVPDHSNASTIVSESIEEALENWIEYISESDRGQKYVLEGIWENQNQLQEIKSKLDAAVEYHGPETRLSNISVLDDSEAAKKVSQQLESGRPVTSDIFVDRPEIPKNLSNDRYLVIGRRGMGKTRTLDYLQSKFLSEKEIDQVILPDQDLMATDDAVDFSHITLEGNVLLVWDDIQGLRSDQQQKTVRQSIVRLAERVRKAGNSLYIVASLRSEFLDEIPNLDRTKDRVWQEFEEINLKPLDDDTVAELFTKAEEAHELRLEEDERQALIKEIQYTDPSPLYVESVVNSIDENRDIATQIDELPRDAEKIWEKQYDRLTSEHPETRFVLWSISLLRLGAIPPYESTLRKLFSQVFDRDRFQFQTAVDVLTQKQWIWEIRNPDPDTSETVYATRAAQMSAVTEDRMRVMEEYVDFLLSGFAETVPSQVEDWIGTYYGNTAMALFSLHPEETAQYTKTLLERAVELDPYNPTIRNNFATFHQIRGNPEKSLEHYEIALSVAPEWAGLRNTYASTLDELGRVVEAKEQYHKTIDSDQPQPVAHYNLATMMVEMGEIETAKQHYEKALQNGYHSPDVYLNLGVLYTESGDYLKGIEIMEEGLEVSQNHPAIGTNLAKSYLEINRPDKAVEILQPILDIEGNSRVHGLLALAYSELGERNKAMQHGKKSIDAESDDNPLGEDFLENMEVSDVRDDPEWEEKHDLHRVVDYLVREEQFSKAWKKGQDLIDTDYESSDFRLTLGDVAEKLDFIDEAEQHYQKAIQLDEENETAYHHYANFLKHQHRFEEAEARFEEGLEISDDPDLYNDYALLLMHQGQIEEAESVLSMCLDKVQQTEFPESQAARIHNNFASSLFNKGHEEQAREHYNRALELHEEYPRPRVGLGQLEAEKGNIDAAIEHIEEGLRLLSHNGDLETWGQTLRLVIDILEDAGRHQDAIQKCNYGLDMLSNIGATNLPIFGALQYKKSDLESTL